MKHAYSLLLLLALTGCSNDTREQLDKCTAATDITYPPGKSPPMGQPYKDILSCMQEAGYIIDVNGSCKYRDYTASIGDASCYRPAGALKGYFHDVTTTLR